MMKIMNWLNSPVTWGGYLKLCGIVCAIYGISLRIAQKPYWRTNQVSFVNPFTEEEIDE